MGVTRTRLLLTYLSEIRAAKRAIRPSVWDCAIFIGTWVHRCTGRDVISDWHRSYSSFESGFEALSKKGINSLADLAATELEEVPDIASAQPGDVAVLAIDDEQAFGIVGGPHVYVLAPPSHRELAVDCVSLSLTTRVFRP